MQGVGLLRKCGHVGIFTGDVAFAQRPMKSPGLDGSLGHHRGIPGTGTETAARMGKQALFCVAVYVLCSLLTADAIPVDPKFDPKKFSGKWYPLLTGSHHQPPPDKVFALTVKPLGKGGFSTDIEMPINGTCQVLKFNFKPTEPGYFKSEDEKAVVRIVESNNEHGVITVLKMDDVYILQLFVRKPKVSSKWRKRFNDYAEKYRFNSGKVQDISHAALCEPPPKKKTKV